MALADSALFALIIGALSLRTRGVYFIMITLAFAQMAYYVGVRLGALRRRRWPDHLNAAATFAGLLNLSNKTMFYYVCLALLFGSIYLVWRLVNSRFGMVVQGARSNETRMRAIGFPTYRYKLACFVIAGTMCGLAGALLANHTDFVSPAMMYLDPLRRPDRHGRARRHGDAVRPGDRRRRAAVPRGIRCRRHDQRPSVRRSFRRRCQAGEYWQIVLGPLLLLVVLFARGGIDGFAAQALPERPRHG